MTEGKGVELPTCLLACQAESYVCLCHSMWFYLFLKLATALWNHSFMWRFVSSLSGAHVAFFFCYVPVLGPCEHTWQE